jgi:hypothetical protein
MSSLLWEENNLVKRKKTLTCIKHNNQKIEMFKTTQTGYPSGRRTIQAQ